MVHLNVDHLLKKVTVRLIIQNILCMNVYYSRAACNITATAVMSMMSLMTVLFLLNAPYSPVRLMCGQKCPTVEKIWYIITK